ncbi:MAG: hypothetical protein FRX48_09095 [Lasallia pustulata]|uniref:Uncharacterized protein n=1 Tax=Lasallia pustulata TaxID=136370 RepID=A0A5M8PCJ8_9LECA|nr:MAG: hypothetical protein FRX48_09095 [Lasallia pustulata]
MALFQKIPGRVPGFQQPQLPRGRGRRQQPFRQMQHAPHPQRRQARASVPKRRGGSECSQCRTRYALDSPRFSASAANDRRLRRDADKWCSATVSSAIQTVACLFKLRRKQRIFADPGRRGDLLIKRGTRSSTRRENAMLPQAAEADTPPAHARPASPARDGVGFAGGDGAAKSGDPAGRRAHVVVGNSRISPEVAAMPALYARHFRAGFRQVAQGHIRQHKRLHDLGGVVGGSIVHDSQVALVAAGNRQTPDGFQRLPQVFRPVTGADDNGNNSRHQDGIPLA